MICRIKQRPQYTLFVTLHVWGPMRRPRGCRGHHPSHREHQEHSRFAIQHNASTLALLRCAHRFELVPLVEHYGEMIGARLRVESVADVLQVAEYNRENNTDS